MTTRNAALPGTPAGQVVAETDNGIYRGYNLRNTASSAAVVRVYAGSSTAGTLLATVALAADDSADMVLSLDDGTGFAGGVFVETVSGTTPEGFIRWSGAA